jgi:hypothetical protein
MTPNDRSLWIDLMAVRYLEAIEREDFAAQLEVWNAAEADPELSAALHEIHVGLIEESAGLHSATITDAAARHLVSGEVIQASTGPVTVADIATELFLHTPDRLPAEAHALNDRLRSVNEAPPADLGFSRLIAWAESKFGTAPLGYWKAFYAALVKLDLRRASVIEYQLAARASPNKKDKTEGKT